jgi:hypothetical protein
MHYTKADVLLIAAIASSLVSDLTSVDADREQAFPRLGDGYGWDTMFSVCAELADHVVAIIKEQYPSYSVFYEEYMEGTTFTGPGVFVYDIASTLLAELKREPYSMYYVDDWRTLAERAFAALKGDHVPPGQDLGNDVKTILLNS